MPVPQVEPTTWKRVEAIAQIEMGRLEPRASTLSFNRQLDLIIENTGGAESVFSELYSGGPYVGKDLDNRSLHPAWEEETEIKTEKQRDINSVRDEKYSYSVALIFSYESPDRDRVRRPQISNDVMFRLASVVQHRRERVPVQDLDFQQVLELFLDELEEAYSEQAAVEVAEIEPGADVTEAVDLEEKMGKENYQTKRPFYHVEA